MSNPFEHEGSRELLYTIMNPRGLDIASAAKIAGVGRTTIYQAIKAEALPAFKFGRRTIIYRDDLQAWMNAQPRLVLVKG